MLSTLRFRSFAVDLRKVLPDTMKFSETQKVLKHMTTNRTGKEGDCIFCTPMMIEHMDAIVLKNVAKIIPQHQIRISKVQCAHKAPLGLGESFVLDGTRTSLTEDTACFRVLCQTVDRKKVLGDATITIRVSENW